MAVGRKEFACGPVGYLQASCIVQSVVVIFLFLTFFIGNCMAIVNFKKTFASDNWSGICPEVLQAIIDANQGHAAAYGGDVWTQKAVDTFKDHFGDLIDVYFVLNGTAANVLGLMTVLKPYQAVICAEGAHINVDECGATEKLVGCKLLSVPTSNGKLTVDSIKHHLQLIGNEHHVQPKLISITQATEIGTVYTPQEIKELADFAHAHHMFLHMDGARIANAAAYLDLPLRAITTDVGVDILSFGGTKNGMMLGEAVIFFNPEHSRDFKYIRKQNLQLTSKMRFIAAQFIALLSNDLWKKNAQHSNMMAQRLAKGLATIPNIVITQPVQANGVFAIIPSHFIAQLQAHYFFHVWNQMTSEVRLMTSFDTTPEEIDGFIELAQKTVV